MTERVERSLRARYAAGETFAELVERLGDEGTLWSGLYNRAVLGEEAAARAQLMMAPLHLLVLSEDWCGDSVNILPVLARLEEASPGLDMRILSRDGNPDIMDAHLTGTSRSIPVAIAYDDEFVERGWWGPRPGPLQRWATTEGLALSKPDRYRHVRTWYARDRGATIVSEVLSIIERRDGVNAVSTG